MVPCASRYEIEKQFQAVYTISKFKEVQEEFTGKMYCDLVSVSEGLSGATYEVREDVIHEEHSKKKSFFVSVERDKCEITCSCHNFEFRGIICRHMIVVLARNDVKSIPEKYILRRWRRDVSRAHTRVPVNYDGLISTPGQLKYDKMCQRFATLADLTAEDDAKSDAIIDWIDSQCEELMSTNPGNSNILSPQTTQTSFYCEAPLDTGSGDIRDPECVKRKGAPKKLRKKSPLETMSRKFKASTGSSKGKKKKVPSSDMGMVVAPILQSSHQQHMPLPFSYTNLLLVSICNDLISMITYYLLIMLFHAGWEPKSSIHATLAIDVSKPSIGNYSYNKHARFGNAF
ncbi:FAR1-RELATED SEQUENCE 5-like [Olea europaea subsp. europaea]|uniref:Protein FAR1-RELATED SEQUENCE n=1 Tax=Olea europaea subsp. europaea TaxID=158383 RepID=A0A8S0TZ03_OLEEU|nr:FAR1-RELATED SEQUENCE 5-like [Olea europaea subsp. europaea]